MKSKSRLPSEYQEVKYIESTGTQYIDTGIKPTKNTRTVFDFEKGDNLVAYTDLFGAENEENTGYVTQFETDLIHMRIIYKINPLASVVIENRCLLDFNNDGKFYVNNELVATKNGDIVPPDLNLYLFANNNKGTQVLGKINCKLYSCKLYDGNTLVRNFIPCYRKSNNEIGLLDIVNNVFYTNQGTGTFLKGKNV